MADTTGKTGWIYVTVDDVEASAAACETPGGEVIVPVQGPAGRRSCVIRDPAGPTVALYQP